MLARKHRIPKNLFPLLKKNTLYEGEVFDLRVTKTSNKTEAVKCACIISKKTEKKAVNRNLMKRRVYSILGGYIESLENGMCIQIFPKKKAFTEKYADVSRSLQEQTKSLLKKY